MLPDSESLIKVETVLRTETIKDKELISFKLFPI